MYAIHELTDIKRMVGRPKREDKTERANLKLNSSVRKLLKNQALIQGRNESAQVEQLIIQSEALQRILNSNPEISSALLPKLNQEIQNIVMETKGEEND